MPIQPQLGNQDARPSPCELSELTHTFTQRLEVRILTHGCSVGSRRQADLSDMPSKHLLQGCTHLPHRSTPPHALNRSNEQVGLRVLSCPSKLRKGCF